MLLCGGIEKFLEHNRYNFWAAHRLESHRLTSRDYYGSFS